VILYPSQQSPDAGGALVERGSPMFEILSALGAIASLGLLLLELLREYDARKDGVRRKK
jgi:hypothetical protein